VSLSGGGSGIVGAVFPGRGLTRNATGSVDAFGLICRLSARVALLPPEPADVSR
jgi:hypothetical protein